MVSSGHLSLLLKIRTCSHVHTHSCTHLEEAMGLWAGLEAVCLQSEHLTHLCPAVTAASAKYVCAQGDNAGKQFFFMYICLIITPSFFLLKGPVWSQIDLFTSYCLDRYSKVTTSLIYWCLCFIMHLMVLFLHNEWVLQWEINWNASLGINQCTHTTSVMGCSCSVVKVFFWNGLATLPYHRFLLH